MTYFCMPPISLGSRLQCPVLPETCAFSEPNDVGDVLGLQSSRPLSSGPAWQRRGKATPSCTGGRLAPRAFDPGPGFTGRALAGGRWAAIMTAASIDACTHLGGIYAAMERRYNIGQAATPWAVICTSHARLNTASCNGCMYNTGWIHCAINVAGAQHPVQDWPVTQCKTGSEGARTRRQQDCRAGQAAAACPGAKDRGSSLQAVTPPPLPPQWGAAQPPAHQHITQHSPSRPWAQLLQCCRTRSQAQPPRTRGRPRVGCLGGQAPPSRSCLPPRPSQQELGLKGGQGNAQRLGGRHDGWVPVAHKQVHVHLRGAARRRWAVSSAARGACQPAPGPRTQARQPPAVETPRGVLPCSHGCRVGLPGAGGPAAPRALHHPPCQTGTPPPRCRRRRRRCRRCWPRCE